MQYSIINYIDLEKGSLRLDSEYYHPKNIRLYNKLLQKPYKQINDFAFVTDGIHASIDFDPDSPIKLISAKAPKENYFDLSGLGNISVKQDKKNPRTHLKNNDVIISTVGTIGNVAVIEKSILPANSDRHVGIVRIQKDCLPRLLSSFLLSKYGRFQTLRESTGNVQLNLFIYKIKEIIIPTFSSSFQNLIENTCLQAQSLRDTSKSLYSQAETILLSELRLTGWKPKHRLSFVKNYSATKTAERIDAEYFQPKYEEIIEAVRSYKGGYDLLGDLVNIKKCVEPGSDAYQDEGIPFVRVSNLSKFEISTNNQQYISKKLYLELSEHQPQEDEILLSKDATPGIAYHLKEEPQEMIPSGGILRLAISNKNLLPEYLTLVLNSTIVQKQMERDAGGSIIKHWRPDQVENTLIPILKQKKQDEIQKLIDQSFQSKQTSKSLLEIAKHGVETAIEQNEEEAENWINEEVKKLGVEL